MFLFYFSISLVVASSTLYHTVQKLTPANANPALSLVITYLLSALLCLVLIPFYPLQDGLKAAVKHLNWTSVGLSFAILGLELGFLLAYRAGWNLGLTAIFANATVALILIPVGLVFFKEKITPANLIGVAVCIIGLLMVNKK